MTALIPVVPVLIDDQNQLTVDGRTLHAFLEVGRDFPTWMKFRIEEYGFEEGKDFHLFLASEDKDRSPNLGRDGGQPHFNQVFPETGENLQGGRPTKEYRLTLDMAKELSMVERNAKGKQARRYFIECERIALEDVRRLALPAAFPVTRQSEEPRPAQLSHKTLEALQQLKNDLKITGDWTVQQRPNRISPLNCVALLDAVLDDIVQWRYPHPFAYGFDISGKGVVMIRLTDLVYHLRKATHFKDFFSMMQNKAQHRIEQELTVSGLLEKVKAGPIVDGVRLNCRLALVGPHGNRRPIETHE